ncbi:MAG: stage III sporulation protein AE [Clostridiales bacterium]|jgi:stage III sporulation protein AE|nr:stage III sporulation protein AE [Clostridiales bacterium]
MKKLMIVFMILAIFSVPLTAYSSETSQVPTTDDTEAYIDEQLETFDFSEINKASGTSFGSLVSQAIKGQLDLSPKNLANQFINLLFGELKDNWALLRNLLLIAILSAVLNTLTDSFKNKSVGELGFFVCYMALVMVLFSSFQITMKMLTDLVGLLSNIMTAAFPIMLGVLIVSGNPAGATAFPPIFAFSTEALTLIIRTVLIPLLTVGAVLEIINFLVEKDIFTNLAELIRDFTEWALKGVAVLFLAVLSLQKISAPIINNLAVKAAKAAAGAVPMVGGMISGAMDTVILWGSAAKSGALVALVITIITACALPLIKILVMFLIYRLTGAVIQPICDKRIADCIKSIGDFCKLILSAGVIVAVMFIVSVVIMLSF